VTGTTDAILRLQRRRQRYKPAADAPHVRSIDQDQTVRLDGQRQPEPDSGNVTVNWDLGHEPLLSEGNDAGYWTQTDLGGCPRDGAVAEAHARTAGRASGPGGLQVVDLELRERVAGRRL